MDSNNPRAFDALIQIIQFAITHLDTIYDVVEKIFGGKPFDKFIQDNSMAQLNFNRQAGHSTSMVKVANEMAAEGKRVVVITLNAANARLLAEKGLSNKAYLFTVTNLEKQSAGMSAPDVVFIDLWSYIEKRIPWSVIEKWWSGSTKNFCPFIALS